VLLLVVPPQLVLPIAKSPSVASAMPATAIEERTIEQNLTFYSPETAARG
jgi:hypothetical protein